MLAWVVDREGWELLRAPAGMRVERFPDDPLGAPGRDEVAVVVPPNDAVGVLAKLPALRLVQTLDAGVEWIEPHVPPGVTLCNARGVTDVAVAEWVVAMVLAELRALPAAWDAQREGRWYPLTAERRRLRELAGSRAVVVGRGSIGAAVEERLAALGVEVAGVASRARPGVHGPEDLPELLATADVVVVVVPLTDATRGMVDARFLAAMPDGALLVNAARGAVVDTGALLAELRAGRLRAALDVTDPEPLPAGHPLWTAPGVRITAHLAGDTPERVVRGWALVSEQLARFARGEPLRNVI